MGSKPCPGQARDDENKAKTMLHSLKNPADKDRMAYTHAIEYDAAHAYDENRSHLMKNSVHPKWCGKTLKSSTVTGIINRAIAKHVFSRLKKHAHINRSDTLRPEKSGEHLRMDVHWNGNQLLPMYERRAPRNPLWENMSQ